MKVKPKNQEVTMLEWKFELNVNGVIEEIAVMKMLILPLFETLDMQLEHSEDGVTDIHKESCDEKDEDIPEEPRCH